MSENELVRRLAPVALGGPVAPCSEQYCHFGATWGAVLLPFGVDIFACDLHVENLRVIIAGIANGEGKWDAVERDGSES